MGFLIPLKHDFSVCRLLRCCMPLNQHVGYLNLFFIFVVRDQGRFGFLLPEEQIHEVAEEMIEGMKVMAKHVLDLEK